MKRIPSLLALCLTTASLWAASPTFVGEWKLDPSRTRLTDQMKVVSVSGNKYAFDLGGGAETIAVDGTDQPGVGGTTLSVSAAAADAWKVVRKKDGRIVITADWKLSPDGNTLTDHFTSIGSNGSPSTVNYLYKRTAGTSGFAGTWESNDVTMPAFVLKVQPFEKVGLSFINSSQEVTRSVKFDGHDYPLAGPTIPSGFVSSARRVDDHTLEMTDKFQGRVVDTQQVRLSRDGHTLTMTRHVPGQREASVLVFERQ